MKYPEWYANVSKMMEKRGLVTAAEDIPYHDYWCAGIAPEDVIDQAIMDGYYTEEK